MSAHIYYSAVITVSARQISDTKQYLKHPRTELYSCQAINFLIALTHAINYFNHMLINTSLRHVYLCCMLPSANVYTSHLQDATTVELAIEQFLRATAYML